MRNFVTTKLQNVSQNMNTRYPEAMRQQQNGTHHDGILIPAFRVTGWAGLKQNYRREYMREYQALIIDLDTITNPT